MAQPRLSVPDALLRLWLAAALGMTALYGWQAWTLATWPADMAAPQPPRGVALIELMYLCLFVPAAVVVVMRWRTSRDRRLAALAIAYALASAASFAAWAAADSVGMVRALYWLDAVVSLGAVPVALRALMVRS
jgi:uncharacterized membrane protein YhaH (DUF805 family)